MKQDAQPNDQQVEPRTSSLGSRWVDALGLAEGGLLLDVAVILDLATIYLPLIGPVIAPAVPTPFAVLMLRRGPRVTLLAAAVSAFLVTIITGPHFGWRMGLQALIGMLLGGAMRRGARPTLVLAAATLLLTTVGFCATFGLILLVGYPIENIVIILHNSMTSASSMITTVSGWVGAGPLWQQVRPTIAEYAHIALQYWVPLYYLYVAFFSFPTVVLYYAVANASARILGHRVKPFPPHWVGVIWRIMTVPFLPLVWVSRLWDRLRHGHDDAEDEILRPPAKGTRA
ncbi:MAG TPA: DUF2232 domain-containing protein [Ktedonobacterales bacterium]|jgi:uncharacterized protein YybS (DUF2232 family)|nr:DUF2232 domain-containing protein [Ktedonobacterales bacterium]